MHLSPNGKWLVSPGLFAIRAKSSDNNRPASLYVIGTDEQPGLVKIGIATNINFRISELQTANPFTLKLIASRDFSSKQEARKYESSLHKLYRPQRVNGEWFQLADADALAEFIHLQAERG